MFTFDKVFGENSTQEQIFDEVRGVVGAVMDGFNGAVMAYGQTSAGKSHTMEGSSLWEPELQGIIPRCINLLFEEINRAESSLHFQVIVSYFEVYCEKVRDLLNPQAVNLKVRETKENGFMVQDITEMYCTDRDSVMRVLEFGKTNRASAPTLMNAESSRSHSILSILVDQRNSSTGRERKGVLYLVDLAGSEKVSKTGASGMRLEEAKNINSSLTTLGMVINSLCDGAPHVPYRDSKLTMILMDALGGNSKTTLIICCTKEHSQSSETLSTLRFGERAKKIQNHAKINEELSVNELKAMLEAAKKEIITLKKKLAVLKKAPGASSQALDTLLNPTQDTPGKNKDESQAEIREKEALIASLTQQLEEKNIEMNGLQEEIDSLKSRVQVMEEELDAERQRTEREREEHRMYEVENTALKVTISSLEDRLVKVSLSNRRNSKSQSHAAASQDEYLLAAGMERVPSPSHQALQQQQMQAGEGDREEDWMKKSKSYDDSYLAPPSASAPDNSRPLPPSGNGDALPIPSNAAIPRRLLESSLHPHNDSISSMHSQYEVIETEVGSDHMSIPQLQEHAYILNAQLENEILTLSHTVSQHASETRTALESAQKYADKYLKLREDYEVHIQRLMLKLTQEQQARTILEDQLENATRKVLLYSRDLQQKKSSGGGLFAWLNNTSSSRRLDYNGRSSSHANQDPDMALARALELSNLRVAQLSAENDQLKESHSIVVETKESVINTLSRRVSEISDEVILFLFIPSYAYYSCLLMIEGSIQKSCGRSLNYCRTSHESSSQSTSATSW